MFSWIKNKWNSFMNNEELKRKIYVIIFEADTPLGKAFDVALIVCIVLSVLIVIMESVISHRLVGLSMRIVEWVFTVFFTLEYLMRLYCAKNRRKYVFSFFGIIDLLATLPAYLGIFFAGAQSLMVIRVFRIIRIFRIFKLFSFLKEGQLLLRALYDSGRKIVVFFLFVLVLVISIGTIMYLVEGDVEGSSFNNIPNSIYWAIVTMTTVGYGDITPVTPLGRFLCACVMLLGYTILAVPTGIVSASMIKTGGKKDEKPCPHCKRVGNEPDAVYCKYCGKFLEEIEY